MNIPVGPLTDETSPLLPTASESPLNWFQKHWPIVLGLVLAVVALVGLFELVNAASSDSGAPGKSLWDWLQLLMVPLFLAVGGVLLNATFLRSERKRAEQQQTELQLAEEVQRENALQSYLDDMTELLLDRGLRKPDVADEIKPVARARTLTTLRMLDGIRRGALVRFLYESGLIREQPIISLVDADLRQSYLVEAMLSGANLAGANLSGANLTGANLADAQLQGAHLKDARLAGANLTGTILEGRLLEDGQVAVIALPAGGRPKATSVFSTVAIDKNAVASRKISVPILTRYPLLLDLLEVFLILVVLFFATRGMQTQALDKTLPPGFSSELNYLVNSGAVAAEVFHRYGAIPLWNPLVGHGEPLFDSLFSFVLNPFMTVPLLALGVNDGVKVALLIHIALMALGGWALGRALKLHAGALLLGLMLAGSGGMLITMDHFIQIGSSLAYAPWVYAGFIGFLYGRHQRRWLGVFVVALTMMTFAGTYWFVVPAVISCAVIGLFALIKPRQRGLPRERIIHMVTAGLFFFGFALLSLLPRLNSYLVYHPAQGLGADTYDLSQIFNSFFVPDKLVPTDRWFAYQYMIPGWFALAVVIVRLALLWLKSPLARWRILLPSAILILFFCVWAQDNTPIAHLFYDHSFLIQWRWPVRVAAAAAPFIAIILAVWFEEIVRLLVRVRLALWVPILVITGGALFIAAQSFTHPDNSLSYLPVANTPVVYQAMQQLRAEHPDGPLAFNSEGLIPHFGGYTLMMRTTFGNPDVFTHGLPSDYPAVSVNWSPPYALGTTGPYRDFLQSRGYQAYPNSTLDSDGAPLLWARSDVMPYAFTVSSDTLDADAGQELAPSQVESVGNMDHRFDTVQFNLQTSSARSLLVVQEIDYPGWVATVDGQSAPIQSFDEMLSVILPPGTHSVAFTYHSPLLELGLVIFILTLIVFACYLLRLDQRLAGTRFDPVPRLHSWLGQVGKAILPQVSALDTASGFDDSDE